MRTGEGADAAGRGRPAGRARDRRRPSAAATFILLCLAVANGPAGADGGDDPTVDDAFRELYVSDVLEDMGRDPEHMSAEDIDRTIVEWSDTPGGTGDAAFVADDATTPTWRDYLMGMISEIVGAIHDLGAEEEPPPPPPIGSLGIRG